MGSKGVGFIKNKVGVFVRKRKRERNEGDTDSGAEGDADDSMDENSNRRPPSLPPIQGKEDAPQLLNMPAGTLRAPFRYMGVSSGSDAGGNVTEDDDSDVTNDDSDFDYNGEYGDADDSKRYSVSSVKRKKFIRNGGFKAFKKLKRAKSMRSEKKRISYPIPDEHIEYPDEEQDEYVVASTLDLDDANADAGSVHTQQDEDDENDSNMFSLVSRIM
ncbi:hypothetical protein V5799_032442 [Amblyomma americanum]|uniref:Uncharacterized protein n=1 Tax=Amblyomma americanum TaxID=6943 RepID=A0AAQ4DR62_AMBAM